MPEFDDASHCCGSDISWDNGVFIFCNGDTFGGRGTPCNNIFYGSGTWERSLIDFVTLEDSSETQQISVSDMWTCIDSRLMNIWPVPFVRVLLITPLRSGCSFLHTFVFLLSFWNLHAY